MTNPKQDSTSRDEVKAGLTEEHRKYLAGGLVAALRRQRQVDEDGTEVGVSREAVDVAASILESIERRLSEKAASCLSGEAQPIVTPLQAFVNRAMGLHREAVQADARCRSNTLGQEELTRRRDASGRADEALREHLRSAPEWLKPHPSEKQPNESSPAPGESQLVCYETYTAIGTILFNLAERGHPQAEKLLDNLSQARLVHKDVLPFAESCPAQGDAVDAARYRWLRDQTEWESFDSRWLNKVNIYGMGGPDLDEVIDARLEAAAKMGPRRIVRKGQ